VRALSGPVRRGASDVRQSVSVLTQNVEIPVEHVDQHRPRGRRHDHVSDRDDPQAPPQVLGDIGRGYEHLVGERGVVDATAPDLLLEDRDEIVDRNIVWRAICE
jgi:hypothetical protein